MIKTLSFGSLWSSGTVSCTSGPSSEAGRSASDGTAVSLAGASDKRPASGDECPHRASGEDSQGLGSRGSRRDALPDRQQGGLGPGRHSELAEDVAHMGSGGAFADHQRIRDLLVGEALGHQD
jgi:hypothetical protein